MRQRRIGALAVPLFCLLPDDRFPVGVEMPIDTLIGRRRFTQAEKAYRRVFRHLAPEVVGQCRDTITRGIIEEMRQSAQSVKRRRIHALVGRGIKDHRPHRTATRKRVLGNRLRPFAKDEKLTDLFGVDTDQETSDIKRTVFVIICGVEIICRPGKRRRGNAVFLRCGSTP